MTEWPTKSSTLSSSTSPVEQFQKQTTHIILQTAIRHYRSSSPVVCRLPDRDSGGWLRTHYNIYWAWCSGATHKTSRLLRACKLKPIKPDFLLPRISKMHLPYLWGLMAWSLCTLATLFSCTCQTLASKKLNAFMWVILFYTTLQLSRSWCPIFCWLFMSVWGSGPAMTSSIWDFYSIHVSGDLFKIDK